MRDYAKVSPKFWIGATGKQLRAAGPETQIVAMYLLTCPHANMLGLYYLPRLFIEHETGLSNEGASKGLASASEAHFCLYDEATEMVWVLEMASYQVGESLQATDNRVKGIQREYDELPENPFLEGFFDRYASAFHLTNRRENTKGLGSPSEDPPKPRAGAGARTGEKGLPASPRQPRRGTTKSVPEDFAIDDDLRGYVTKLIPDADPDGLFDQFKNQAIAKGWLFADPRRGFQNYVRNSAPNSGHFAANQYPKKGGSKIQWQ